MSLSGEGDVASPTGDLTQFVLFCSLSISAFVRACGLVDLPLLLFPVLCSTGHDARAPLECAPHGC